MPQASLQQSLFSRALDSRSTVENPAQCRCNAGASLLRRGGDAEEGFADERRLHRLPVKHAPRDCLLGRGAGVGVVEVDERLRSNGQCNTTLRNNQHSD